MLDIVLQAILIIACAVIVILFIAPDTPTKQPSLCDRCKNLYYKRSPKDRKYYRYVCKVPFKKPFDIPPEYCANFEERENDV